MFERMKEITREVVRALGISDDSAFSGILVASIMAVMIGAILLVLTFTVVNAVVVSSPLIVTVYNDSLNATGGRANVFGNAAMNASQAGTMTIIGQALGIVGIGLIVVGIAGIIYVVAPLAGILTQGR